MFYYHYYFLGQHFSLPVEQLVALMIQGNGGWRRRRRDEDGQMVLALSVNPRYARKECLSDVGEGGDCEDELDQNAEKGGEEFEGEGLWNVKRRAVKSVVRGMR